MSVPSFFSADVDRIKELDPVRAVDLFRDLLYAEAFRLGLPPDRVHISADVNTADGGIDASVDPPLPSSTGPLSLPTGFQLKAGKSFKPWQKSALKEELLKSDGTLKPEVKRRLESGHRYITVCFGHDLVENDRQAAVQLLRELVNAAGYPDHDVDIWGAGEIAGHLGRFPALCLELNGTTSGSPLPHRAWASQAEMRREFRPGPPQDAFIAEVRRLLSAPGGRPIRLVDEPGLGKTRLILEATNTDLLRPTVIYFESGRKFTESELFHRLQIGDTPTVMTLVLDECSSGDFAHIVDRLGQSSGTCLIAIDHGVEIQTTDCERPGVPPLGEDQMAAIFDDHGIPKPSAMPFVRLCGGSPRVAHLVAENLRQDREDLTEPADVTLANVWDRYIHGPNDSTGDVADRRVRIARWISLFERFGYRRDVNEESRLIATLAGVSWEQFSDVIADWRGRKVLQGDYTYYITPKMLHIHLWRRWWDAFGETENITRLLERIGGQSKLLDWFIDMFRYAAGSPAAQRVVDRLLAESGPFAEPEFLNSRRGADFSPHWPSPARPRPCDCWSGRSAAWTVKDCSRSTRGGTRCCGRWSGSPTSAHTSPAPRG